MISIFLFPKVGQSMENIYVSGQHAVLMEETTGRVIFEKRAHERQPVASITKVMTAIVALEYGTLSDKVKVSERAVHTGGSSIYLEQGEKISLEDLLYGLMLRSGNDASVAIAEHIGASVEGFVYLMNEKAHYLGMTNTHFMNPHGLDEEGHYSSAYDIALLMRYAMQNEIFEKISSTKVYRSKNWMYSWYNKNKLLTQLYEPCTGGKTGFTKKAGRTLVTTASKDGLSLIVVTLNAPDDWRDHMALYEHGFENYEMVKLEEKGERILPVKGTFLSGWVHEDIVYPLEKREQLDMEKYVVYTDNETEDKIGQIIYTLQAEPIMEVPVYREKLEKSDWFTIWKTGLSQLLRLDDDG